MNADNISTMPPNTYRRLLAAHGRSSTLGVFDCSGQIDTTQILKKLHDVKSKEDELNQEEVAGEKTGNQKARLITQYLEKTCKPPNDALVNPPLSKAHSIKPKPVVSSYSFYQRPFKVNGKEAWEFAMRDLGSIDTLLNRYGYVQPQLRGKVQNIYGHK